MAVHPSAFAGPPDPPSLGVTERPVRPGPSSGEASSLLGILLDSVRVTASLQANAALTAGPNGRVQATIPAYSAFRRARWPDGSGTGGAPAAVAERFCCWTQNVRRQDDSLLPRRLLQPGGCGAKRHWSGLYVSQP